MVTTAESASSFDPSSADDPATQHAADDQSSPAGADLSGDDDYDVGTDRRRRVSKNSATGRQRMLFFLVELLLFASIPLLGFLGFRTLLDTRTGTFVEELVPTDPGWQAIVDPSPVIGVVEVDQDRVTGVALVATPGETARGGAVMLFPGSLRIGDAALEALGPEEAVAALEQQLRLRIPSFEILDTDRWGEVLGDKSYPVTNPDPVPGTAPGEFVAGVGAVEVSSGMAAAFVGRVVEGGDPLARLVRRELLWNEVLADPPDGTDDGLARLLRTVADGPHEVSVVPYANPKAPVLERQQMELMLRRLVPFPAGSAPGDRLKVTVMDRTGEADLDVVAALVGAEGYEVVGIGNAAAFDEGPTQLLVPADIDQQVPNSEDHQEWRSDLAIRFGASTVEIETLSGDTVTLLIGSHFTP